MRQRFLPPGVKPLFPLGNVVVTGQAFSRIPVEDRYAALGRHAGGDLGNVCGPGLLECLKHGLRIHSAYRDRSGVEFWIITEADRKTTTVLLPEDY